MRIRGKKPWALIEGKIVRFKNDDEFRRWSDDDLRRRLDEADNLDPDGFFTPEQVWEHLERHRKQRHVFLQVTRRPQKRKIRRRRLWPA
jgi:hypothetical protein